MTKKHTSYVGELDSLLSEKILLNINHLKDGTYTISIISNNKIIKSINFTKTSK